MGNSESSSQIPAGTEGKSGIGRGNKSEEENDETSSTSIRTAVKVGAAVAGTALMAWGAWNMATSSWSEHPEDDRRRNALGAAQQKAYGHFGSPYDSVSDSGAGGNSRGGRGLITDEHYSYQRVKNYHAARTIKFMTYNVWKQEREELRERIQAIGRLVEKHDPDVIFFQLSKLKLPIIKCDNHKSTEGREFPACNLDAGSGTSLLVANGHLIRPNSPAEVNRQKRKKQAKAALDFFLDKSSNAVFGGDMNWNEDKDGSFPLPEGWVDAWTFLKGSNNGWTYDTQSNGNLKNRNTLQKRLDRFVCKLSDFELLGIELIGKEPKPPSDHYGLLLTIGYKSPPDSQ